MDKLNQQIVDNISLLLVSKPILFILAHSIVVGIISGIISLIPFKVKRVIHILVLLVVLFSGYQILIENHIDIADILYATQAYSIAEFVGNYCVGCLIGFAIANGIQRIRGEHNHVN